MSIFKMHQTSISSKHDVGVKYSSELSKISSNDAFLLAEQFFAIACAIKESPSLMRALTDKSRDKNAKIKLVKTACKSINPNKITVDIIAELSSKNWSKTFDFYASICEFGINFIVISLTKSKQSMNSLKSAEDDLFMIIRTLKDQSTIYSELNLLRDYLSSEFKPLQARLDIVDNLVSSKVNKHSLLLAKFAVLSIHRDGRFVNALQNLSDEIANMRGLKVAHVCSTVPPSKEQIKRIEELLEEKYNTKMQINIVVDPNLLGGIRIRVGESMFDHSILNRLHSFENEFQTVIGE